MPPIWTSQASSEPRNPWGWCLPGNKNPPREAISKLWCPNRVRCKLSTRSARTRRLFSIRTPPNSTYQTPRNSASAGLVPAGQSSYVQFRLFGSSIALKTLKQIHLMHLNLKQRPKPRNQHPNTANVSITYNINMGSKTYFDSKILFLDRRTPTVIEIQKRSISSKAH